MNTDRAIARSIAASITVTTPGRVTLHAIRRRAYAPILVWIAWAVASIPLILAAFVLITR